MQKVRSGYRMMQLTSDPSHMASKFRQNHKQNIRVKSGKWKDGIVEAGSEYMKSLIMNKVNICHIKSIFNNNSKRSS